MAQNINMQFFPHSLSVFLKVAAISPLSLSAHVSLQTSVWPAVIYTPEWRTPSCMKPWFIEWRPFTHTHKHSGTGVLHYSALLLLRFSSGFMYLKDRLIYLLSLMLICLSCSRVSLCSTQSITKTVLKTDELRDVEKNIDGCVWMCISSIKLPCLPY